MAHTKRTAFVEEVMGEWSGRGKTGREAIGGLQVILKIILVKFLGQLCILTEFTNKLAYLKSKKNPPSFIDTLQLESKVCQTKYTQIIYKHQRQDVFVLTLFLS